MKPTTAALLPLPALVTALLFGGCNTTDSPGPEARAAFPDSDRVWVGPEFWANRLRDWRRRGARIECVGTRMPLRTLHVVSHRIEGQGDGLTARMRLGTLAEAGSISAEASAGFLIGAGAPDLDWRSACLVQTAPGPHGGIYAGIRADGRVFVRDHTGSEVVSGGALPDGEAEESSPDPEAYSLPTGLDGVTLEVRVQDFGDGSTVSVTAVDPQRGTSVHAGWVASDIGTRRARAPRCRPRAACARFPVRSCPARRRPGARSAGLPRAGAPGPRTGMPGRARLR